MRVETAHGLDSILLGPLERSGNHLRAIHRDAEMLQP